MGSAPLYDDPLPRADRLGVGIEAVRFAVQSKRLVRGYHGGPDLLDRESSMTLGHLVQLPLQLAGPLAHLPLNDALRLALNVTHARTLQRGPDHTGVTVGAPAWVKRYSSRSAAREHSHFR